MQNYSDLITAFIEGKVQNRFIAISQALKDFIEKEASIIETVNVQTAKTWRIPLENLESNRMAEYFRTDAELAKKCLIIYNLTFSRIDNQLAIISSNFNLPRFLAENGVPEDEINTFQRELGQYWDLTYQPLIDRFITIKDKLERLRKILQMEIYLLENMPNDLIFPGLKHIEDLRTLFGQERELFWEIVKDSENLSKNTEAVQGLFSAQKKRTREYILAYLVILKSGVKSDWELHQGAMARSILCLAYLAGALNVYINIKSLAVKHGVSGIAKLSQSLLKRRIVRGENEIIRFGKQAVVALKDLTPSAIEQLLGTI